MVLVWLRGRAPAWNTYSEELGALLRGHMVTAWVPSPVPPKKKKIGVKIQARERVQRDGIQTQLGIGVNSLSEPRTQTPCRKARCMCDT